MALRTVFMGTPEFAVPSLRALHGDPRVEVALVVSQPDRPAGRGQRLTPPPVAAAARELGLPTWQPESLRPDDAYAHLAALAPELIVVAAYGQILRPRVLAIPRLGCVNVHASLLPRWRGAAPIHRAIQAGDAETGVCIMRMEAGLDTGPVYLSRAVPIGETTTSGELTDELATLGATLLVDALDRIADPGAVPRPQPEAGVTYAAKLGPADRDVDFSLSGALLARHVNAMSPSPGARVLLGAEPLTLWRARAHDAVSDAEPGTIVTADRDRGLRVVAGDRRQVEVLEAQRPGRKRLPALLALEGTAGLVGALLRS